MSTENDLLDHTIIRLDPVPGSKVSVRVITRIQHLNMAVTSVCAASVLLPQ